MKIRMWKGDLHNEVRGEDKNDGIVPELAQARTVPDGCSELPIWMETKEKMWKVGNLMHLLFYPLLELHI